MIIKVADYVSTADYIAAVKAYLKDDGAVYLNRVEYALERYCRQTDYFINILGHQENSVDEDTRSFPGFKNWPTH